MRKPLARKTILIFISLILLLALLIKINFLPFLFQLIFNKNIDLKRSEGRINVLFLGTGGEGHEGPNLTDTIIFASIDPGKNKITLISIPRDLWVPDLKGKINTAYAVGENKKKEGGLILAKSAVSKILNQPIDYAVRLDFQGFVQAVDLIGGLDINVDRSFDDYQYPIAGKENDACGHSEEEIATISARLATGSATELQAFPCRYIHIKFTKGLNHMDGKTALRFVRSRHAVGFEGTDFARSKRQEKVIKAFKDKILSPGTIFNPVKLLTLYATLKANIDTDINSSEFDDFIRLGQNLKTAKFETAILDYGRSESDTTGLLIHPNISKAYDFEWVLIPRIGNGSFEEIQGYIECEIVRGNCKISEIP